MFSFALVLGGLALVVPDLYRRIPQIGDPRFGTMTAASLVLLGAAGGLLALRQMRRGCRAVQQGLQQMLDTGTHRAVTVTDRTLEPLVHAVNQFIAVYGQRSQEAQRRARELEIQLKVVHLEREHAQSIIQSISDAVLVTDPWDELVLANESASRVLGFKAPAQQQPGQPQLRQPIESVLRDVKLISLIREMRATRSAGGRKVVEHRVRQGDVERTFKVTLSCLGGSDRSEAGGGVVAVMHDMTHEAEVARMKNDFVSHVSHELRTPLASIKAYVEMLIDGEADDDKQTREFYDVIQNESNRLGRLIDNILDISRIESGVVKIKKVPLSLTVVINEAMEIITPQASGKNITVTSNIAPAIYQVTADKDMIHRAVLNLLSNAVKYTPEGGSINVSTQVDASAKKITAIVEDTGVGIPPKDMPFVFDKFYRVEANSRMAKGTGLGLSLVKHIVESVHHGRVFLESTVGKGSRFGIELDLS